MRKLLLVFALIAIVACADVDLKQEFDKLLEEIKLNGVDWGQIWAWVSGVGCAVGAPACCAVFPAGCAICNVVFALLCG